MRCHSNRFPERGTLIALGFDSFKNQECLISIFRAGRSLSELSVCFRLSRVFQFLSELFSVSVFQSPQCTLKSFFSISGIRILLPQRIWLAFSVFSLLSLGPVRAQADVSVPRHLPPTTLRARRFLLETSVFKSSSQIYRFRQSSSPPPCCVWLRLNKLNCECSWRQRNSVNH